MIGNWKRVVAGTSAIVLVPAAWFGLRAAREAQAMQARVAAVCPRPEDYPAPPRTATPSALGTTGQIFVSHAWSRRVFIIDVATGQVTPLDAGNGYTGEPAEAEKAFAYVIHLANKGIAHKTGGLVIDAEDDAL